MKNFIKDLIYIWKYEGKLKAIVIVFLILFVAVILVGSVAFEVMKFTALYKYINQ